MTIPAPPLLQLRQLVAGWQSPSVGPISFDLQRGEVLGLQGPNGTGKSTLLAAIIGRASIFNGELSLAIDSRVLIQTQQQPPLHGLPLTGRELLSLTSSNPSGLPTWLTDTLDSRLDQLSGGQRQFLALWAILNAPADLILLDEPSNNLDLAGSQYLAQAIRQRARTGAGIMLVSHEAELLGSACDRCIDLSTEAPCHA